MSLLHGVSPIILFFSQANNTIVIQLKGVMLNRNYFGTGFNRPPGNDCTKTVLSWHYYCWFLNFKPNPLINGTYPKIDKILCDDVQLKISFEAAKLDMIQLGGGPSFLTEFGVCAFSVEDSKTSRLNVDECRAVLDATDKYLQSWAYWDSRFYNYHTLEIIPELVDIFSRVYPMKTNGIPISLNFNSTSKNFSFLYHLNVTSLSQAKLPTEIHIPPNVYPFGFNVKLSPFLTWSYDKGNTKIQVYLRDQFFIDENFLIIQQAQISIYSIIDLA